jgi:hypothetical protein
MEIKQIAPVCHLPECLGMSLSMKLMKWEIGKWNGEDGIKAAKAEKLRINVRPRPNILLIQNASVSRCKWL